MWERRKLEIPFDPPEPDPPPFTCDVCGKSRDFWQRIHHGEKSLCWFHQDRKVQIPLESRVSMDWRDYAQLAVISTVIGELKNECS